MSRHRLLCAFHPPWSLAEFLQIELLGLPSFGQGKDVPAVFGIHQADRLLHFSRQCFGDVGLFGIQFAAPCGGGWVVSRRSLCGLPAF